MLKSRAAAAVAPVIAPAGSTAQDAFKQALLSVVQVWLDRLQHQAVVTTFFVSIDSLLFSLTSSTRGDDLKNWSARDQVINASLGGAIIFHVFASIVAYVASFVLIRYRLDDAEKKEHEIPPSMARRQDPPAPAVVTTEKRSIEKRRTHGSHSGQGQSHGARRPSGSISSTLAPTSPIDLGAVADAIGDFQQEVYADLRGLVSVYRTHPLWFLRPCCGARARARKDARQTPRGGGDPEVPAASAADDAVAALQGIVGVLSRAHTVCAGMSSIGFVLALLGILTYSWTAVPTALGIFASASMGVCALVTAVALR